MVRWFQNTYAGRRVLRGYEREGEKVGGAVRGCGGGHGIN